MLDEFLRECSLRKGCSIIKLSGNDMKIDAITEQLHIENERVYLIVCYLPLSPP